MLETPIEDFSPAALWRRLAAMLYDSMLVFAIWMVVAFLVLRSFGVEQAQTLEGDTVVLDPLYKNVLFLALMLSTYSFFAWFWTHSGQTLGMQAWKIKVQNPDGSSISAKQSAIRFVLAPFSFFLMGAGYFWILLDPKRRSFHDIISKTQIVKINH